MTGKKYLLAGALVLFLLVIGMTIGLIRLKTEKPSPGDTRVISLGDVRLEMVYIPAGEFRMGSDGGWIDEKPVHPVRITKGFWLGKTEVTQGLWRAVMNANPSGFQKGDSYPVETISWLDCQRFIRRLNGLSGVTFRLPTEAEWEYACRGGDPDDFPENLDMVAWFLDNAGGSTQPVGLKLPNAFGLYDMLGNVWEWCADYYEKYYYARSPLNDPTGPLNGSHRVDRGGGWIYARDIVRPSRRDGSGADYATNLIGFRLAADGF